MLASSGFDRHLTLFKRAVMVVKLEKRRALRFVRFGERDVFSARSDGEDSHTRSSGLAFRDI